MLLSAVELRRQHLSRSTEAHKKSQLGQFLTPAATAAFMAQLFPRDHGHGNCRLLDAGAGIGSLCAAFLARWQAGDLGFRRVQVHAFEIDPNMLAQLALTFAPYRGRSDFEAQINHEDFIHASVMRLADGLFSEPPARYTHAILNPPYKKINSQSPHRLALRSVGIETVNLYSAFVALALAQVEPGGHLVAIIPRSFCNGPYYRPFRDFMLARAAIRHLHLFTSRTQAFKDDHVLQENVILHLQRAAPQSAVTITTSTDDSFGDLASHIYPFAQIVLDDDPERFIHVPTTAAQRDPTFAPGICCSLAELGLMVSTGPVVDFRLKEHLRAMPEAGSVPLLYPGHFSASGTVWPVPGWKKPNAIVRNAETEKWLYPNGFYCAVRRFSSKEERRRVVANVVEPTTFGHHTVLGFENHINLFHDNKHGMPEMLARGLTVFLNTTAVDESFRRFNGHTQVNATDLRRLKYPNRATLFKLGHWAASQHTLTQTMMDEQVCQLTA